MGLISGFIGGITSLLTGPKSRGNPAEVDDPQKIAREQGITSAYRSEIVRRNQQRTSSLKGTGADFISSLKGIEDTGPMHEAEPVEEVVPLETAADKINARNKNSRFGSKKNTTSFGKKNPIGGLR